MVSGKKARYDAGLNRFWVFANGTANTGRLQAV